MMPAPSESPRTLVVVLKRSLEERRGGGKNRKRAAKAFLLIMLKAHLSQKDMTSADVLHCLPALCISNLCGVGAWQPSEALRWHLVPADPQNPSAGQSPSRWHLVGTHRNQSTAMISVMSSVGSPTDVNTITMVTRPAWGMPAAPMLAAVAVILCGRVGRREWGREGRWGEWRPVYKRKQTTTTRRELQHYYNTVEITLSHDLESPSGSKRHLSLIFIFMVNEVRTNMVNLRSGLW